MISATVPHRRLRQSGDRRLDAYCDLTDISEPCGCRLAGDKAGLGARYHEQGAMRLRASSGLTQPV